MGVTVLGIQHRVALRKESVDRNPPTCTIKPMPLMSLSARRAWIEIDMSAAWNRFTQVALRKESVDRNSTGPASSRACIVALRKESVDRNLLAVGSLITLGVALRKESVDRNASTLLVYLALISRSPQGERG